MGEKEEEYVDGGLNLSAVARPFVPQFTTSPSPQLSLSPPQKLQSSSSQLGPGAGGVDSLSLPPLGAGSQPFTPGGHDWNADLSLGGGSGASGSSRTGTGASFLWQGGGNSSNEVNVNMNMDMNMNMTMNKTNINSDVDDSGFDMMGMNLDMLGGLDDLLQPPVSGVSGGGSHSHSHSALPSRQGSLLEGLVSSGGVGGGGGGGSGLNPQPSSTSRFLNLGGEDEGEDTTSGDFFQPNSNHNNSNVLSSSLNDFMTNMGEHHNDFAPSTNDIQSVFSSNNR